jgi:hypothetical protein
MLKGNYKAIEKVLNYVEDLLKIDHTTVTFLEKNRYLLRVPLEWCKSTYMISLYSLLVRIAPFYTKGDIQDWLEKFQDFQADVYLMKTAMVNLKKII